MVTVRVVFFLAAFSVAGFATAASTSKDVQTVMLAENSAQGTPPGREETAKGGEDPKNTMTEDKYIILPFSRVLTRETRDKIGTFGKQLGLAQALADKLDGKGVAASVTQDEPPMDHHNFDGLYLTIDVKPPEPVEKQLDSIRKKEDRNAAGILLGHLVEDLAKEELRLTVRYCATSCSRVTVVYDNSWRSDGVKEQTLEEALGCVANWVQEGTDLKRLICLTIPAVAEDPNVHTEIGASGKSSEAEPTSGDTQPHPATKTSPLQLATLLPTEKPQVGPSGAMTLEYVYGMIYDQEFYAYPPSGKPKHEQAMAAAADQRGIALEDFKEDLGHHSRDEKLNHSANCRYDGMLSKPAKRSGSTYRICFHPDFQTNPKNDQRCKKSYGGLSINKIFLRRIPQIEQDLANLNQQVEPNHQYRLPTIEELFALTAYLPQPPLGEEYLLLSSTPAADYEGLWWGISMSKVKIDLDKADYRPRLVALKGAAYLFPVRTCP